MEQLITIPIGVFAQVLLFMALRRYFHLGAKLAGVVIGLAALAIYVPYALIDWPGGDVVALHVAIFLVTAYGLGLILANREARLAREGGSVGWFHWGPAIIVGFFVGLILFDTTFVVVAQKGLPAPVARWLFPKQDMNDKVSTVFPGVSSRDYQTQQEHFNKYLAEMHAQELRGWQVDKGWLEPAIVNRPTTFQVVVLDRDQKPVAGAEVTGVFMRLSDTTLDQRFNLKEVAPGVYRQDFTLPAPGVWELDMTVRKGKDVHHLRAKTSVQATDTAS